MKDLFPHFDRGTPPDFKKIWKDALFVFDANVLLNLYRYQSSTRDQLIDVLQKLSDQIWIPHHAALEFQRNRLVVVADQNKRFQDVRNVVKKAQNTLTNEFGNLQLKNRHSLINPEPMITEFDKLASKFLEELSELEKQQQQLDAPDELKDKIETLFVGRVGEEPEDQKAIDTLYKEGEVRYRNKIPPGFKDADKTNGAINSFCHGGITYKNMYGDLVIWDQILRHAKKNKLKTIVFVTDDAKEDWWWKTTASGDLNLGPLPELVEEAHHKSGVLSFSMFQPLGFLKKSNEFLEANVSEEALNEVRDLSNVKSDISSLLEVMEGHGSIVQQTIMQWLSQRYESVGIGDDPSIDFFAFSANNETKLYKVITVGLKLVRELQHTNISVIQYVLRRIRRNRGITQIVVASSRSAALEILPGFSEYNIERTSASDTVVIGYLSSKTDDHASFLPVGSF